MAETTKPVIVLATANRSELLPPELLRRFDAIWWFDAPAPAERAQIWTIHLRKRGRDVGDFDLEQLVSASDRYTGAEIEKAVKQALRRAFADGARDVTTDDLVGLLTAAQPLAITNADQITAALDRLNGLAQRTHADPAAKRRGVRRPAGAVRPLDLSEPAGGAQ
jgi:SpoVK/Ycf46/Vps4 family AAA+-type ATPase